MKQAMIAIALIVAIGALACLAGFGLSKGAESLGTSFGAATSETVGDRCASARLNMSGKGALPSTDDAKIAEGCDQLGLASK